MFLLVGSALLAVGALLVIVLAVSPRQKVPLSRRRPYEAASTSQLTRFAGSTVSLLERYLSTRNLRLYTRESLELAGLKLSQADFLVLVFAGCCVAALVGLVVGGPLFAMVLVPVAPLFAHLFLKRLTSKRRAKFDQQLTDTIQLLTGSLRAGHSILRAIDATAMEASSPTAEEMRRVVTETRLGKDLLASLNDIADRMNNEDFIWIAQAIQINREVGGNLAEVLDQVNETIRERGEIKGQIKALAAEGKFSAYILVALPFGVVCILLIMSPGYMNPLFSDPLGWILIAVSCVLMTVGSLWLRKIIDLKF